MKWTNPSKWSRINIDQILFFSSMILFLIAAAYLAKGFYNLTIDNNDGARDLFERWQEQQYIYQRQYPYFARQGSVNVIPSIGPIRSGGYPPWAFFTGFLFFPNIPWEATRIYHALLNFISLGIVGVFAYRVGLPYGKSKALFSLGASLAVSSNCTTLNNGQYGLIINAMLIGVFWGIKHRKQTWAGLLLALAMTKPNISAFYFFIPFVYRQFNAIIVFLIYLIFGSIFISTIVRLYPLEMMADLFQQFKFFVASGSSGISTLKSIGFDPIIAMVILGGFGIIAMIAIFRLCSACSLLTLFASASVIGRIVTYHRIYDNVMLIFLLLAVMEIAWIKMDKLSFFMMLGVGLSLWLPAQVLELNYGLSNLISSGIWLTALGYTIVQDRRIRYWANL